MKHQIEQVLAEQKLDASEKYFRSLFENMPQGYAHCRMIFEQDVPHDFVYINVNHAFERLTGLKNVTGKNVSAVIPGIRESSPELFEIYGRVAQTGQPQSFETYVDALKIWFSISVYSPEREYFVVVFDNINARKEDEARINRLTQIYAALSLCNESILLCDDEAELFLQICRAVVQHGGMKMAWIGLIEKSGKQIRPVASFGEGTDYLQDIQLSMEGNDPYGLCPAGALILENQPFWFQDYQHDPVTAPWHKSAAKYGWRAFASLSLLRKNTVVGKLMLYSDTVNAFDEEARKLLLEIAGDTSFAISNFAYEAERKLAIKLLEEKEQHFRAITETANDAIITTGASADSIVDWNAAAERVFGYKRDEIIGQSLLKLIPERFRDQHIAGMARMSAGEAPHIIGKMVELNGLHRDGSEFPLELSLSRWQSDRGLFFTAVIRDITNRKQTDKALREKEYLLSESQRIAHVGSWRYEMTGQLIWSDETYRIYGVSPDTFTPNIDSFLNLIHPDDRLKMQEWISASLADNKPDELEIRIIMPDGTVRFHSGYGELRYDAENRPNHLIGIVHDITERKQAELQLRESETRYKRITEGLTDYQYTVLVENGHAVNTLQSSGSRTVTGYMPIDFVADPYLWIRMVAPEDRDRIREHVQLILAGKDIPPVEYRIIRKDGAVRWVSDTTILFKDTSGKLRSYDGVIKDITEHKTAEEQIQRYVSQLESAFMRTVGVANNLIELRDPYTAGHQRRVAEIAAAIGSELGLDARRIEGLRVAGQLHDIGKISTPAEILAKPGRITVAEYMLIKEHPQNGYVALKDVGFPWPVAEVAWQHHERIDGSGYPRGLKGDEILLEARIMSVADVVEAMASHRPYRPGHGIDKALEEIERGIGSAYDKTVAEACLRLFRERGYMLPL